ncbi:MAG: nicotinamide-nucleotide amidase [Chloroflexi bacterium]|nr:MAG: nicotinamide-nucleotide amidase [Chloroflexota bacterium]
MDAEIIAVGTELLMGELVDSNSAFLASELPKLGMSLKIAVKIGDDINDLVKGIESALTRSDVVITTGGLGPTSDDLTRESIARFFEEKMEIDPKLLNDLEVSFAARGIIMPKTNIKQASLIPSSIPLPNPNGTAPGWFVSKDSKIIIAMPGPPMELIPMWKDHVVDKLTAFSDGISIVTKNIKTFGRSEGELDEVLSHLFGQENPYLGIYSKQDGIHLRAIAKAATYSEAASLISQIEHQIIKTVGASFIWGQDDDTAAEVATNLLHSKNLRLCITESYTGGAVCGLLSESETFDDILVQGLIKTPTTKPILEYQEPNQPCSAFCQADVHLNISPLLLEDPKHRFGTVNFKISSNHETTCISGKYRAGNSRMRQRASNHALIELIRFVKADYK